MTESGWSNSAVFRTYLEDHFLKFVPGRGDEPVLLLLDGHKSHVSVGLVDWAKEHNIIIYVLPAHTSHFLQPLDVGCYGPLHRVYNNECHKETKKLSTVVTKYDVCRLACRAYSKALSSDNLQMAFKRAGVYPLDQSTISEDYLLPSEVFQATPEDLTEKENVESEPDRATDSQTSSTGDNVCDSDADTTENSNEYPGMAGDFFRSKVADIRKVKTENQKEPRKTMSRVTSGHCITEEEVRNKMVEHEEGTKKSQKRKSVKSTSEKSNEKKKAKKPKKQKKHGESQEAGPSGLCNNDSEEAVPDQDKCCVCKLYTPVEIRHSLSLIFTKWVQCDRCPHWVHLIYCTKQRVVRKEDVFLCQHCQ